MFQYEEKLKNANIEPSSNAYVTELEEMLSSRQATLKEQIEKNQELQQKLEAVNIIDFLSQKRIL